MAEWSLKWLYYLNYYLTKKCDVFGFGVSLITIGYLLFNFHKFKMATSKMAISKMAFHFGKCVHAPLCFRIFIGPAAILEGKRSF